MRRAIFSVAAAAAAALAIGGLGIGCSGGGKKAAPHHPLAIIGIDGLEWTVLRPLLVEGKMPNLRRLVERGVAGKLYTFEKALSPVVWTTIATGKTPREHGILNFRDPSGQPYTSNSRRGKALWNIASDYQVRTLCVGWWDTWPAEEVVGFMVAPYSAAGQDNQNWKGNLFKDLADQTWPRALIDEVFPIAESLDDKSAFAKIDKDLFGGVDPDKLTEAEQKFVAQTRVSVRSDHTFAEIAKHLLGKMRDAGEPPELTMVYLGGPDVASHRFWKFRDPAPFKFPVAQESIEQLRGVIDRFYQQADRQIGSIVDQLPPECNVIVCSDHGFGAANTDALFDPMQLSGHHLDGPPGIFVAAGPDIVTSSRSRELLDLTFQGDIEGIGRVLEVAPVAMYLLGIPLSRDFASKQGGSLMKNVVQGALLEKRSTEPQIFSHDEGFREPSRPLAVSKDVTEQFMKWLQENGYLGVSTDGDYKEALPKRSESPPAVPARGGSK